MPHYPSVFDPDTRAQPAPFGPYVRDLRKYAGLTLEQLAKASGISRAALSRIEREEMSPTYESLLKLASGLGMDLAALVSGRRPAGDGFEVTRAGRGADYRDQHFTHRLLAPDLPHRSLLAFVSEVRATTLDEYDTWDRHDSEDFLYVLEGTVAVHLEGREPVELRPGDSVQMDGRIAHALVAVPDGGAENLEQTPFARLLWVSVPASGGPARLRRVAR